MFTTTRELIKKYKEVIIRILFTIFILFIFRVGAFITVPGVTLNEDLSSSNSSGIEFFNLISMLGGGAISRFSVFALGVSPYITASIIVQLLSTDVVPTLTRWAKSGEKGKKKLELMNRVLTVPFAIMQGFATIFGLQSQHIISVDWSSGSGAAGPEVFYYVLIPAILLAGTMLSLWMADQITNRGIGNGISLIIFGGIAANLPFNLASTFKYWVGPDTNNGVIFQGALKFALYFAAFLLIILVVVFFSESERHLPIQQTGSGLTLKGDKSSYLPLKVNSAGVIPVIFSSALITAPMTVAQIVDQNSGFANFARNYLSLQSWPGISIFAIMTIMFTFLYAQVQINPEQMAKNFQKSGTYIPGVQPGKETEVYIKRMLNRLSTIGSFFLTAVAVTPFLISKFTNLPSSLAVGGTGLIIMVGVALDTTKQIKGRITQHSFLNYKENKDAKEHLWS
ncbi:MAG: preprotein translocase subunit SecY [Spiroplasma endosymbiont of Drosophila atripex]|nr:MAG: preprotein translocase subunit SecY [Spiroplasma endosymbiont of Drosophila atripex]